MAAAISVLLPVAPSKGMQLQASCHVEQAGLAVRKLVELPRHIECISSLANPYVKHLVRIRESSAYRQEADSVLVVGSTPLREICEFSAARGPTDFQLQMLLLLEGRQVPKEVAALATLAARTVHVTEPVMRKIVGLKSSEAIDSVGVVRVPTTFCKLDIDESIEPGRSVLQSWCQEPKRLLVLDGIQDPGNLGSLLRTAAAFAWDGVFLLPGCCDLFNDKVMRASRGASFRLPVAFGSWTHLQAYAEANKMKLYAGSLDERWDATTVERVQPSSSSPLCLVLGSEGQGLSNEAKQSCEHVKVPMPGNFESLNVAVAGGIFMYLLGKSRDLNPGA